LFGAEREDDLINEIAIKPAVGSEWRNSQDGKVCVVTGDETINDSVFISFRTSKTGSKDRWLGLTVFHERFTLMSGG
jgi:hypothetical protein